MHVDVRVCDDAGVVHVVLAVCMWEHAVCDEDVASLRDDVGELFALRDVLVQNALEGRVEAFGVIVEILADTYTSRHVRGRWLLCVCLACHGLLTLDAVLGDESAAATFVNVAKAVNDSKSVS